MVFLEGISGGLLTVHLLISFVTLYGLAFGFHRIVIRKGKIEWLKANRLVKIGVIGFIVLWVIGLLIYPTFRVNVRAEDFDKNTKWTTALFEIKEHVGSMGVIAALALLYLATTVKIGEVSTGLKRTYAELLTVVLVVTIMKAAIGLLLTSIHSL